VFWFGLDDTYSTVYVPMYCGITEAPKSYAAGTANFSKFSWDSAWWVFNFVANWAYSRYSDMIVDIQVVQNELEAKFLAEQPEIDKAALKLLDTGEVLARRFLTEYSGAQGELTVARWRKLGEFLIWKYLDGNVRDANGNVTHPTYPDDWYRRIVQERGEALKVRPLPGEAAPTH
jgi:dipeptidase